MFSVVTLYILAGLTLELGVALAAGLGLGPRRMALAGTACLFVALAIPVAERFAPFSVGLPLAGGAVIAGGFLAALRLFWHGWRAGPRGGMIAAVLVLLAYALAGLALPQLYPSAGRSAGIAYRMALLVLALPMLGGAAAGSLAAALHLRSGGRWSRRAANDDGAVHVLCETRSVPVAAARRADP